MDWASPKAFFAAEVDGVWKSHLYFEFRKRERSDLQIQEVIPREFFFFFNLVAFYNLRHGDTDMLLQDRSMEFP